MNEEQKQAYREKLEAKLDGLKADLDKIQAKINEAKADTEVSYLRRLEDLRTKRKDLKTRLSGLKEAAESGWEDVKASLDESWERLKEEAVDLGSSLSITDKD